MLWLLYSKAFTCTEAQSSNKNVLFGKSRQLLSGCISDSREKSGMLINKNIQVGVVGESAVI